MRSLRLLKVAVVAASLGAAADASAFSLGLNFVNNANAGIQNGATDALLTSESAGAPGYAQVNWNNLGRWGQTIALMDSSGAASGVTATWDSNNTWNSGAGTTTPNHKLMHGYLDATGQVNVDGSPYQFFWNENKPEVYLTGISSWLSAQGATQYNVVVYIDGDTTGRIGEYWLQDGSGGDPPTALGADLSTHVFVRDAGTFAGAYTQVPLSANTVATAGDGNYVVFQGLSANSFMLRTEERNFRAQINGLQIVPISTVLRPGDADGDGDVDLDDFAAIRDHFQKSVVSRNLGDLNEDGFVDFVDFRQWKANYPFPAGGSGSSLTASVPEPATWFTSLAMGLLAFRTVRCRR
jgi:hypothetical protein